MKRWGTGRPGIIMRGWPISADSWDDHAMAIANAGMRAIAYDGRGFGSSNQPCDGHTYDTLADDLAAVIEQAGANNATIIGFSMGGGTVARYQSRHGEVTSSKRRFRNAELHRTRDGKLISTEVYFG